MTKLSPSLLRLLDREVDPAFRRRARLILQNLDLQPRMKVLEIGCGRGFYEIALLSQGIPLDIVAIDMNENYLAQARENIKSIPNASSTVIFEKGDATKLKYKSSSFDRVICSEVLEHVPDDVSVIREIKRLLNPHGKALLTVPNASYPFLWDPLNFMLEVIFKTHVSSHIWWLAGIWADHMRLYSEKDLATTLKKGGLRIMNLWQSTHYAFPFTHFLLYAVGKNLVEKKIIGGSFDRFTIQVKPSFFHRFISFPFQVVDRFNSDRKKGGRCVNMIVEVTV